MRDLFKFIASMIAAGIAGAFVTFFFHVGAGGNSIRSTDVSYADFLSVTLTALALMITILGFFVAAAGVIGWTTIENKLRDHSINYFKDQLGSDGKLREEIEQLIEELTYRGIDNFTAQKGIVDPSDPIKPEGQYND